MPHINIEITQKQKEQLDEISKSTGFRKSHLNQLWWGAQLDIEYNKTPQSVLDNLKFKGDDEANA